MARPRIFISSTYYDLRQVRSDIERSIQELGYEPVLHEAGAVPYGKEESPESSAYREVERSDVIVFITGGSFGSESTDTPGCSISQVELKKALENGIQVFIFVEKAVLHEYQTYKLNRESEDVKYASVSDTRVFQFLDELYKLPRNNPITQFELASDISKYLRDQFAGLFHRFLQENTRTKEVNMLREATSIAGTLKDLVRFLTEERTSKDDAIKEILLSNHPAFRRLKSLTKTTYRVYFVSRQEMETWLTARGYKQFPHDQFDSDSVDEWQKRGVPAYLKFTKNVFDEDDKLRVFTEDDWKDDWITLRTVAGDDEGPF